MRFLKTLSLNRRAIYDDRLAVDTASGVVMNTPNNLLMPKGATSSRPLSPTTGMIRYNTTTNEVEVYQGIGGSASWRSLSFKESTGIIQQNLGLGDDIETAFGPLTPRPPTSVDENLEWSASGNATTPGNIWTGANLIVLVENVFQIYATNYDVVDGIVVGKTTGQLYVRFSSPVPTGKPVTVLHGFDR
jgi:hypothetical protein